jgi:hypothetical protein
MSLCLAICTSPGMGIHTRVMITNLSEIGPYNPLAIVLLLYHTVRLHGFLLNFVAAILL